MYHKETDEKRPIVFSLGGAVLLAYFYSVKRVINLIGLTMVYEKDPDRFPQAKPIKEISWLDYRKMIAQNWSPGMSVPFDPIASKLAQKIGLEVVILDGRNLKNSIAVWKRKNLSGQSLNND